ncbi:MAG: hypothetical protein ABI744_04750 [Chloroflexota bacterium]
MRKRSFISVLFALASILVFAPVVSAASGDRVAGFGTRAPSCDDGCTVGNFSFDAHSGRNGENPYGWFTIDFGYASFTGTITCLALSPGHWATLVGRITRGFGDADPTTYSPGQDPLYFVAVVHGLGRNHRAFPAPDTMSKVVWATEADYLGGGQTLDQVCGDPYTAIESSDMFGLVAGNISVRNR